jgi:hypothetical protein
VEDHIKNIDCPKKGNKGGHDKGNTCSYCHKTGHSEKACFKKKKANQDKQADRAGVDDDFGGFGDEAQPTHRMMREYAFGVHEEGIDHPRIGSAGPENTVPVGCPADGGSRVPASEHTINGVTVSGHTPSPSWAAAAAIESASAITSPRAADSGSGVDSALPRGLTRPAEDDGPVQGERLSKRQRRHQKPPNISTLGGDMDGPPTERACYLAAAALGTETDDTNSMWDKSKVAEMHSQVLENDTYEVVSMTVLAGRMALVAMWACATKSDGRDKSRFLPKGCGQRAGTDYN